MYRPVSFFVGLRYTRAKRRSGFISFISLISILCFMVGVTALIAVLSVMNGFDEQIRERVFSMAPQLMVSTFNNSLPDWKNVDSQVKDNPDVINTAPYVAGQGMLTSFGQAHASMIFGILPEREDQISSLSKKMLQGSLDELTPGSFGIVLGQDLASNLGVMLGDQITLVTPTATTTPVGIMPRLKRFNVVGVFNIGSGFGFDSNYAYININDAQKLYNLQNNVSGIRAKLGDLYKAPSVSKQLRKALPIHFLITNWTEQYGAFFHAIALEKTMMFFILLLIILVAAFSLVSTLFMMVTDKEADVAILRTIGATPKTIMGIFMVQGSIIGLFGTLLGLIFGVLLALNVTELAAWLQQYFEIDLLSSNVYYVDYLPSKLEWQDVVQVCSIAILISLVATIFPAWRASRIQPVEALRYE